MCEIVKLELYKILYPKYSKNLQQKVKKGIDEFILSKRPDNRHRFS